MAYDYEPVVGDIVKLDERVCADRLVDCDDFDAAYRLTGWHADLPVRIEITGRTVRFDVPGMLGAAMLRCRVVFLGDGEPDEEARGWVGVYFHRLPRG